MIVLGRVRIKAWSSGEKQGTTVEVEAEAIGHDLAWGRGEWRKELRSSAPGDAPGGAPGEEPGEAQEPDGDEAAAAEERELVSAGTPF